MKNKLSLILLLAIVTTLPAMVLAQEETPEIPPTDMPIEFTESQLVIVFVGTLGGVTSAYLGSRAAKKQLGEKYTFDIHNFFNRVILACITSIGLAIVAAAGFVELNIFTLFMIFTASLGTAHLVKAGRK